MTKPEPSVEARLAQYGGFVDVAILEHRFAPHLRDYDVVFEAMWGGDRKGTYLLRFTHCPEVFVSTRVTDATWMDSWSDDFIDEQRWDRAGQPPGFCWWASWACAYPGLRNERDADDARRWSSRLGKLMHTIVIETEAYALRVVFHDFSLTKLGDDVVVVDKVVIPL